MSPKLTICTARLELEFLEPSHADVLFDGLCDERLYEFIDDDPPESRDVLRSRYESLAGGKSPDGTEHWLNWAVRVRATTDYVGYVQATVTPDCSAQIAYLLFHRSWGNGYAREAVRAMIEHVREHFCVNVFDASVDTRNHRSIALLLTLGFSESECRKAAESIHGVLTDESKYRVEFVRH